jgi:RNA polymerase sigma-70 factor (ECF subfamily)
VRRCSKSTRSVPAIETRLRGEPTVPSDDQLALILLACHPALNREARVALTLKTVCGFSVGEIARALLSSEEAITQRLVRAKRRSPRTGRAIRDQCR